MKSSALLCFAVAVVATCDAYDFSDPGFNQFIDAELLDIVAEKDRYLRTKRDSEEEEERSASFDHDETEETHQDLREDSAHHGPSCRKHQKGCCGKTPVSVSYLQHGTNSTSTRSALGDCYEEVNLKMGNKTIENDLDPYNCDKVKRMKKRHVCIHECKAKKQEVANEDGLLEFSKVKDLLTARVNETWQKDLLEKAVDYCAKAKYDETWKDDKEEYKCNPQALQFKHCVWKQVETNCPEEHQNQGIASVLSLSDKGLLPHTDGSFKCLAPEDLTTNNEFQAQLQYKAQSNIHSQPGRHCKKLRGKLSGNKTEMNQTNSTSVKTK